MLIAQTLNPLSLRDVYCGKGFVAKIKVKEKVNVEHHAMKAYWGSGGIVPRILDLDTRWR
jgi:hypothetical protein